MSMTDPIADMLTRIRNAVTARSSAVECRHSRLAKNILDVLKREGYIRGYTLVEKRPGIQDIRVEMKYFEGKPVIQKIDRISKPGRRVYYSVDQISSKRYYGGLGTLVLTTPLGVLSDSEAREKNVGGEVICSIF